jgi:hypothetical protein
VLTWFLARWGVAGKDARHLVEEAIGGHFHSWIEPAEADVFSVADRLAHAVGELDHESDEG